MSRPIGTLRLEACQSSETVRRTVLDEARIHIGAVFSSGFRASISASTGGNLAVLANLFPSESAVLPAIDLEAMSRGLGGIAAMTLEERVARLGIRKDVPIPFVGWTHHRRVCGKVLNQACLAPGVGLREAYRELAQRCAKLDLPMVRVTNNAAMRSCLKLARGIIDATRPVHGLACRHQSVRAAAHFASLGAQLDQDDPAAHALYLLENSKSRALAKAFVKSQVQC